MISGGWAGNIAPFSIQQGDPSSNRNVGVTQQFPYPGKLKIRGEIAGKEAEASEADYEAVRRRITADVKAAYFEYFYFDKPIQITQKDKDLLYKLSKISEARYRVGKAKRTSDLIPLCHPLMLTHASVDMEQLDDRIVIHAKVRTRGTTGVEMEALTAASVAGLTLYDMLKALSKEMRLDGLRLLAKSGGQSGEYRAETYHG